jgi:ankyrin repeat protein
MNVAIEIVDYNATKMLVGVGAKTDIADALGRTYLMQSARVGSLPITDLLIAQGVKINAADHRGTTALAIAYRHNKDIVAKYLLKFGGKNWLKKDYAQDDSSMIVGIFNKWQ